MDNHRLRVYEGGFGVCPLGRCRNRSLKEIIIAIATDGIGSLFDSTGRMREPDRRALDAVLNTDTLAGPLVLDVSGNPVNIGCEGMITSLIVASGLLDGTRARYQAGGVTLLFWNQASEHSTTTFPGNAGYIGVRKARERGHTFWGLLRAAPPLPVPVPPMPRRRPFGGGTPVEQ